MPRIGSLIIVVLAMMMLIGAPAAAQDAPESSVEFVTDDGRVAATAPVPTGWQMTDAVVNTSGFAGDRLTISFVLQTTDGNFSAAVSLTDQSTLTFLGVMPSGDPAAFLAALRTVGLRNDSTIGTWSDVTSGEANGLRYARLTQTGLTAQQVLFAIETMPGYIFLASVELSRTADVERFSAEYETVIDVVTRIDFNTDVIVPSVPTQFDPTLGGNTDVERTENSTEYQAVGGLLTFAAPSRFTVSNFENGDGFNVSTQDSPDDYRLDAVRLLPDDPIYTLLPVDTNGGELVAAVINSLVGYTRPDLQIAFLSGVLTFEFEHSTYYEVVLRSLPAPDAANPAPGGYAAFGLLETDAGVRYLLSTSGGGGLSEAMFFELHANGRGLLSTWHIQTETIDLNRQPITTTNASDLQLQTIAAGSAGTFNTVVALSPDGSTVYFADLRALFAVDVAGNTVVTQFVPGVLDSPDALIALDDNRLLVVGTLPQSGNGVVAQIWDMTTTTLLHQEVFRTADTFRAEVILLDDGATLALTVDREPATIAFLSTDDLSESGRIELTDPVLTITDMLPYSDDALLVCHGFVGDNGATVSVISRSNGEMMLTFPSDVTRCERMALSPDGSQLAVVGMVGDGNRRFSVFSFPDMSLLWRTEIERPFGQSVPAFNSTGSLVAVADETVKLYDVDSGELLHQFGPDANNSTVVLDDASVAFGPDDGVLIVKARQFPVQFYSIP